MRKYSIYILFIFINYSSCDVITAEKYYDLAFELDEKGEYKKAIEYYNKAIEQKPEFRPALLNRGADKSALKDHIGAIKDYEKIIAFDSDNTLALMNIGNGYKRLNQYEKSIDYYSKALETKGAINFENIRLEFNKWDTDSDYFVDKQEIKYERGISYALNKQYELAILDLEEVLKYNFEIANTSIWLGESYLYLSDTLNAKKHLTVAENLGMTDAKELLKKFQENK
ncbi:tetratricopeptide repeat protein [Aureibaculum marinum]|uniref:Tetratricopeptide repeat protein n=1 Tax=Aureibaculum marinum TaxID=2487930 RepID=A0A3N4NDX9_9FLAO|nr:tetratricopeptide repeat protein [Aureibaculum marinum]RPD91636.1 tetratricopeptide repeat protein [Aureibaculum marinum]